MREARATAANEELWVQRSARGVVRWRRAERRLVADEYRAIRPRGLREAEPSQDDAVSPKQFMHLRSIGLHVAFQRLEDLSRLVLALAILDCPLWDDIL